MNVLEHLGLKHIETEENYIELLNKADLLTPEQQTYYKELSERNSSLIVCSAVSGQGLDEFLQTISEKLSREEKILEINIAAEKGKEIAWLYENSEVISSNLKGKNISFLINKKHILRQFFLCSSGFLRCRYTC